MRASSANQTSMASGATPFSRPISPAEPEDFFKILNCALGLVVMARASRELAITHLAQHAAQRLLGGDDGELLENPWAEIDDPPSYDPVNRRDRPLEDRRQRRPMLLVQPRRLPRRLAVDQAVRAVRVELEHPVANDLQPDAADLGARGPVVNRRKSQQSARLRPVLRSFRRRPKRSRVIVIPKTNRCRHGEPPSARHGQTNFSRFGNPLRESVSAGTGIRGCLRKRAAPFSLLKNETRPRDN